MTEFVVSEEDDRIKNYGQNVYVRDRMNGDVIEFPSMRYAEKAMSLSGNRISSGLHRVHKRGEDIYRVDDRFEIFQKRFI